VSIVSLEVSNMLHEVDDRRKIGDYRVRNQCLGLYSMIFTFAAIPDLCCI